METEDGKTRTDDTWDRNRCFTETTNKGNANHLLTLIGKFRLWQLLYWVMFHHPKYVRHNHIKSILSLPNYQS